jgi:2-oxoisovalerate dehydrogenase E2 component (dihydrolipoyl transacylase)
VPTRSVPGPSLHEWGGTTPHRDPAGLPMTPSGAAAGAGRSGAAAGAAGVTGVTGVTGTAGGVVGVGAAGAGGRLPGGGPDGRMPTAAEALLATARYDPATGTRRIPVTGVRRATARAMVDSAFTAPHVTEFITIDVTETMTVKERLAGLPEFAGVKLTPLLFAAKALLVAARRHPLINSSWGEGDGAAGDEAEIVVHDVVNLGIAVASPRGLLVPNIPDAGSRSLADFARALADLVEATRAGRVSPADLRGGTITITNIGSLGVDTGTPILNPGEAAVLALGAVRPAPWVHRGELAVRTVAHLALSFDHRIVDGELGSAVLADVAAILTDPMLTVAWS